MTGEQTGSLSFMVESLEADKTVMVWKLGGRDMGNKWNFGSFGFYSKTPYEIVIKGIRGNADSILALDDLIFRESTFCSVHPSEAQTNFTLTPPDQPLQPFKPTKPDAAKKAYDCDFEQQSFCSWALDMNQKKKWMRIQPGQKNFLRFFPNKPPEDHTFGSQYGNYIIMGNISTTTTTTNIKKQKSSVSCLLV